MTIESTTDTAEQVSAAMGEKPVEKPAEAQENPSDAASPQEEEHKPAGKSETPDTEGQETEEEEEEQPQKPEPKGKPKKGIQQRFNDLTRARREAEEKNRRLEEELAALRAGKQPEKPIEPQKPAAKPKAEDFQSYEEYLDARDAYVEQQAIAKAQEKLEHKQAETKARERAQAALKGWNERSAAFRSEHDDFDDVLGSVAVEIPAAMQQIFVEADQGPALAYELAKNPAELERIAKLPPMAAARELGKIEAKLTAPKAPEKPQQKVSQAPDPVNPVGGKGAPVAKKPDEMTLAEYRAWREKNGRR